MDTRGARRKLTLLFGDHRPVLAFASVAALGCRQPQNNFQAALPNAGASYVFELFSRGANSSSANSDAYPAGEQLNVRFYLRNETLAGPRANLQPATLFNASTPAVDAAVSVPAFLDAIRDISISPPAYCKACRNPRAWCLAASHTDATGDASDAFDYDHWQDHESHGMPSHDPYEDEDTYGCTRKLQRAYQARGAIITVGALICSLFVFVFLYPVIRLFLRGMASSSSSSDRSSLTYWRGPWAPHWPADGGATSTPRSPAEQSS
ncbi:hypothetical protein KEM52_004232, partial [Ascosphaera acerosa]